MLISTPNFSEAYKLIQSSKEKLIIVKAQSLEFNRKILEYGKFDIFLGLEKPLNHVMAKLAAKNKILIGLDLNSLPREKKQKAIILSQIIQNIKTCRKAKCKIILMNYKDKKDAFDFLISLGANTQQAKQSLIQQLNN